MLKPFKLALFSIITISSIAFAGIISGTAAYATDNSSDVSTVDTRSTTANPYTQTRTQPLEINPVCSDALSMTSTWQVFNKNEYSVLINWDNTANVLSGTYDAPNGTTFFTTGYNPADPNNTTSFTYVGTTSPEVRNAQVAPCAPTEPTPVDCVDGTDKSNLIVTIAPDHRTATIAIKDGKKICDDITLFFSSYIMPDNYNGGGFSSGNPTAYPQEKFASSSLTIAKDQFGPFTMTVQLPVDYQCRNIQVDVYYAPEITTVGPNGHGAQYFAGYIVPKDSTACAPGQGGGNPTPEQPAPTPSEPTAPVTPGKGGAILETPSELPQTGATDTTDPLVSIIGSLLLGVVTYYGMYRLVNRRVVESL